MKSWTDFKDELFVCADPKYGAAYLLPDEGESRKYLVACRDALHYTELLFLGDIEAAQRLIVVKEPGK